MSDLKEGMLDVEQLRGWINRKTSVQEVVTADLVRRFQATLDRPSPALETGVSVPRLLHFCLAQTPAPTSQLDVDGHPARGNFLPPVPLPRRMWAAGEIDFPGEIGIGDVVRRVSRITDVAVKHGRSGSLCFVTIEHGLHVDGAAVVRERQDIVYRGATSAPPSSPPPAAEDGRHRQGVEVPATLLFRYSALTFNAHRIHYDRNYATQVEGYPGLVVHGPLQATLLLNFATDIAGKPPTRFSFRSQAPLFDDQPFLLHAGEMEGKTLGLWSAREGGPVAMAAEAAW